MSKDYKEYVGQTLTVTNYGSGFSGDMVGSKFEVEVYSSEGYMGAEGFRMKGYDNEGGKGYVGVESFFMKGKLPPIVESFFMEGKLPPIVEAGGVKGKTKDTNSIDSHYNNWYTLTPEDIKRGSIKVDPYLYYGVNSIGSDDEFGCKMHLLKNLSRHKVSNTKEREIIGMYKTIKRMAELNGINLEEEK